MKHLIGIIPFPGPSNDYFIGVDPYGYDGRVATCCVIKKESDSNLGEIISLYSGRPDDYFKIKVQEYVDLFKIAATNITIFNN